jgi:uncharacterized membrane protein YphA (DoxX/SURF4 family)
VLWLTGVAELETALGALGHWLLRLDRGFEILLLVGLSMSLAHLFALVANQLTPRQIVVQLLLDALVLAVALLLATLVDMALLAVVVEEPLQPWALFESLGAALLPGLFTPLAALAILVSMAYAMVLEIRSGFPFIAPDPYQIPEGDYAGPMGVGEPPSWEKAAMYVVMCLVLIGCGGGLFSLDNLLIADLLELALD